MGKCIGGIAHDAVGLLATYKPSKSFGELFEEKKSKLDALQATLAEVVIPKFPSMPAVKYSDIGFGIDLHKGVMPAAPWVPVPNVSMVKQLEDILAKLGDFKVMHVTIQRGAKGRLYAASHTEHKWH